MQAQQQLCPQGEIVTGSHLPKRDETRASVHDARGQGWSRSGAAHMTSRHTGQVIRSSSITPPCAADAAADVAGTAGAANASAVITLCVGVPARYLAPVGASNWRVLQPQLLYRDREAGRRAVPAVFVLRLIVTTLPPRIIIFVGVCARMRRALVTLVSRRVAAFEARPPSRFGAVAWRPASHRSCASSSSQGPKTGPDASRGYDVSEYAGLWRTLNELEPKWPSSQSVAVVGPIGDGFAASALACAHEVVGREATTVVSTQPRSRWQSVRLQVVCTSPDDVCELHSRLRALEGVRAVV